MTRCPIAYTKMFMRPRRWTLPFGYASGLGLVVFCLALLVPHNALCATSFTMSGAVERALEANNSIAAAREGVLAATAGTRAAKGAFGPVLGTAYTYNWSEKPAITSGVQRDQNAFMLNTTLKQSVFNGFKTLSTWQQTALEQDRQRASLADTRVDIAYQVQLAFLELLKSIENIRSATDSLERLRSQLAMTQAFFDEGLRPRLDVLQAEVDVSRAESLLIQAENTRATQQARLNALLALPVTQNTAFTGALDPVPFALDLVACLENAYRQRPDVRMASLATEIAGKKRTQVQADFYPQVSAQLGWSTQGDTFAASGGKGLDTRYSQWAVGATASWDLFSWGTTQYADTQARHDQLRLRSMEEDLRQEVGFEVKSRLLAARNAEKRIVVASKAVTQAREAWDMAVARYQSQLGTNIDVLDAQAKLSLEEANLTTAKADYLSALASLYAGMGEIHPDLGQRTLTP